MRFGGWRSIALVMNQGMALVAAFCALVCVVVTALPGVDLSNSTFKVLTLSSLGSLGAAMLSSPLVQRDGSAEVVRYSTPEEGGATIARDLTRRRGESHLIRLALSSARTLDDTSPGKTLITNALKAALSPELPHPSELRMLVGVASEQELSDVAARLSGYRGVKVHVKAYLRTQHDFPALDMFLLGHSLAGLTYPDPITHVHDDGLLSQDATLTTYFVQQFDSAWNNAPHTLYRQNGGMDAEAMESMAKLLATAPCVDQ